MGLSFLHTGFPIVVLLVSTLIGGASAITGNSNVALGQSTFGSGTQFTTDPCTLEVFTTNQYICTPPPVIDTNPAHQWFFIFPTTSEGCTAPCNTVIVPVHGNSPAVLAQCTLSASLSFSCTSTQGFSTVSGNPTPFSISFGGLSLSGGFFIAFISLAITVACLIGIQVLGSGVGTESIHILFVGGALLGVWLAFSSAEGFIVGSSSSFFTQVNDAFPGGGTLFYTALTFEFLLGTVAAITRGGTNS